MKTLIIMAIPGSGKTTFSKSHPKSFDYDGWFYENVLVKNKGKLDKSEKHKLFLKYLDEFYTSGKYEYIFCPILLFDFIDVRNTILTKYNTLTVYPCKELKAEWIKRLRNRQKENPESTSDKLIEYWDTHFVEMSDCLDKEGAQKSNYVKLDLKNKYLEDGFNIWKKRINITVENMSIMIDL